MDSKEFVANMVTKYVFNQSKYEMIIDDEDVILRGVDNFSGTVLEDVAHLCEVLSLTWFVIIMRGVLELHIMVPEELYERGRKDE